jgi:hypothetical protein
VSTLYNLDVRKFYNFYLEYVHIWWILKETEEKVIISGTLQCDICNVSNFKINEQGLCFTFRVTQGNLQPRLKTITGGWRNCIMRSFIICILYKTLGWPNRAGWERRGIQNGRKKWKQHSNSYHLEDLGIDGRIKLNRSWRKYDVVMWTRFILLSIGNCGGPLGILYWTFGIYKRLVVPCPADRILLSEMSFSPWSQLIKAVHSKPL